MLLAKEEGLILKNLLLAESWGFSDHSLHMPSNLHFVDFQLKGQLPGNKERTTFLKLNWIEASYKKCNYLVKIKQQVIIFMH